MREYINLIQQLSEGTGIVGLSAGEIIKYDARFKKFIEYIEGKKPFTLQVWRWINFIRWHKNIFG